MSRPATAPTPGPAPGGIRPLRSRSADAGPDGAALNPPATAGGSEPDVHRGLRSARRGQFWHRRSSCPPKEEHPSDGVEPGHNSRPGFGRRVCMLLSFQRPSHLLQEGSPPQGRARVLEPVPGRTDEYSAPYLRRR
jgi:hypothetical protein